MRTLSLFVAAIVAATNSGAQTPLTVDTNFQFYYTPELMEYWSEQFAGGNGMWRPIVGDVVLRSDGSIMATGNDLLKRLDQMPWGGSVSVVIEPFGDGSLLQYLPSCNAPLIEIPVTDQYFSNNRRQNHDCSPDFTYGEPDLHIAQRSLAGWHIFDDRSGLCSGYFRTTQADTLHYVLVKVDQWGEWDSTWTPRSAYHPSQPAAKQLFRLNDGMFLFSGRWTHYEGRQSSSIIRIDVNGVQDTTFNSPAWSAEMAAVYEQSDGKVVLGGQFHLEGIPDTLNLIRLNTDGTLDLTFNNFNHVRKGNMPPFSTMFAGINVVEQLDDERLVIGGSFTHVDDAQRGSIACIDTAGNLLDCWANGGLLPMNYTTSGYPNISLAGFKRLANGETYIFGMYKGFVDENGHHPEQVCMSRMHIPEVGIHEEFMATAALRVWPNPGLDLLHVKWLMHEVYELHIRDALGRLVLWRNSPMIDVPINVSELVTGTYTVHVRTADDKCAVAKWLKL